MIFFGVSAILMEKIWSWNLIWKRKIYEKEMKIYGNVKTKSRMPKK
jgi:hypothetical protein